MALTSCRRCNAPLPAQGYRQGRKRKYCSSRCRSRFLYWRNRKPAPKAGRLGFPGKATTRAILKPSMRELGWAAGFLEGEGSFSAYRGTEKISAVQIHRPPLNRLRRIFGGSVKACRGEYHPELRPNQHLQYRWWITGPRARGVMLTVFSLVGPYVKYRIRKSLRRQFDGID